MLNKQLQAFLDDRKVNYNIIRHSPAYTAEEIAASAHISGKELAKAVVVKIDGKLAMVIEPANVKVNLEALQQWTGAKDVTLANENEFKDTFADCETGAMPPLGRMYDLDTYEDQLGLNDGDDIVFNAGNHSELVKMRYSDFEKIAKPTHLKEGEK